jgi:hypothetical protein
LEEILRTVERNIEKEIKGGRKWRKNRKNQKESFKRVFV